MEVKVAKSNKVLYSEASSAIIKLYSYTVLNKINGTPPDVRFMPQLP